MADLAVLLACLKVMNKAYHEIARSPKDDEETHKFIMARDRAYQEIAKEKES
jgi:hypothetical protein